MNSDQVTRSVRFINFLLDLIVFALLTSTLIFIINSQTNFFNAENKLTGRFFSLLIYIGYYFVLELIFKSTPGKFITKTKVVNKDNQVPSGSAILIRSFVRIIPFEPLSIFFYSDKQCWHDRFSKTKITRINH